MNSFFRELKRRKVYLPKKSSRNRAGIYLGVLLVLTRGIANGHQERPAIMPDGTGHVPTYRTTGPTLLVCKTDAADFDARIASFDPALKAENQALFGQCQLEGYRDLQAAVNAVRTPGVTIKVLPGLYQELPSLPDPFGDCASLRADRARLGYQILSWEQQNQCPNNQNLVAIFSKTDLQIEGTGATPTDVMFDAQFKRLNALRADRSNGIYIKNIAAERTTFNAFYIMETDGFVLDTCLGRWNDEYGFLTFADDHGLYTNCEAYGNGDSGIYPGAAHNINVDEGFTPSRYAIEVANCYSHHNALGYSGTAGDSVWAHDNVFTHNTTGVATDSLFPGHPGLPQNHAKFEHNVIADNNSDYYGYVRDGTCYRSSIARGYESGVVCPSVGVPTGTGVITAGGDWDIWVNNWVYGNHYAGFILTWAPGFVRGATTWAEQFDTSHHNRYLGNSMGKPQHGTQSPNGIDFWWDGQGTDNCWQSSRPSGTEPFAVPTCGSGWSIVGPGTARYVSEPMKLITLLNCARYSLANHTVPSDCQWFGARFFSRLEVQISAGEGLLTLLLIALLLWRPLFPPSALSVVGANLGVAGAAIGVVGAIYEATPWCGIGFALLGGWWLATGIDLRARGRFLILGVVTIVLAAFAFLCAIDRTLWILPWIPFSPSYLRLLLEFVWIPWVIIICL